VADTYQEHLIRHVFIANLVRKTANCKQKIDEFSFMHREEGSDPDWRLILQYLRQGLTYFFVTDSALPLVPRFRFNFVEERLVANHDCVNSNSARLHAHTDMLTLGIATVLLLLYLGQRLGEGAGEGEEKPVDPPGVLQPRVHQVPGVHSNAFHPFTHGRQDKDGQRINSTLLKLRKIV
jgi:hypothetical protein